MFTSHLSPRGTRFPGPRFEASLHFPTGPGSKANKPEVSPLCSPKSHQEPARQFSCPQQLCRAVCSTPGSRRGPCRGAHEAPLRQGQGPIGTLQEKQVSPPPPPTVHACIQTERRTDQNRLKKTPKGRDTVEVLEMGTGGQEVDRFSSNHGGRTTGWEERQGALGVWGKSPARLSQHPPQMHQGVMAWPAGEAPRRMTSRSSLPPPPPPAPTLSLSLS